MMILLPSDWTGGRCVRWMPVCGALIVLSLALTEICVWYAGGTPTIARTPAAWHMTPDVAISLSFLAFGAIFLQFEYKRMAAALAVVPLGFSLVTLSAILFTSESGVLRLLQGGTATGYESEFPVLAPNTAVCTLLLSVVLVLFARADRLATLVFVQVLSAVVQAVAVGVLAGHLLAVVPLDNWYGFTRMPPATALGLILLSAVFLIHGRCKMEAMGKSPHSLGPVLALAVGVTLTVALWQAVLAEQVQKWQSIVNSEARDLAERTEIEWSNLVKALDRHAARWTTANGFAETAWRADAVNYVRDFTGLRAFAYSSLDYEVVWVETDDTVDTESLAPVVRLALTRETIEISDQRQQTWFSPTFPLLDQERFALAISPIGPASEISGRFAALFDIERLMRDVIPSSDALEFRVRVIENRQPVFSSHASALPLVDELEATAPVAIRGINWELEAIPTETYFEQSRTNLAGVVLILGLFTSAALALSLWQRNRAMGLAMENAHTSESLAREVAARNHAQIFLAEREEQMRSLLNSTGVAIYGIDLDGRCAFCNTATLRMLGYPDETKVLGRDMHRLIHHTRPDGTPYPREDCRIFAASGDNTGVHVDDEVFWRADGTSFPVEYWSYPIWSKDAMTGTVVTFVDISRRQLAEEALRTSEARFELAVRGTSDGLWDWNIPTNEVWYSDRYKELLGYHDEQDFPHEFATFERILHPDDKALTMEAVRRHIDEGLPFDVEHRLRHRDGHYRWFRARGHCIRDKEGRGIRMAGFAQDVTERRALIERLERLNQELKERTRDLELRNQEVEAFVYIVSHDLRAPLVNIQGFCNELQRSCEDLEAIIDDPAVPAELARRLGEVAHEDIPGALRFITAGTTKFERLIDALLQLSRTGRQTYRFERIDTRELVDQTVTSLTKNIETQGATVVIEALPGSYGDYTALGQVFSNLIANALNFLRPGIPGLITVGGEISGPENTCHFWVQDNGIGIPPAFQDRIFQVFQRVNPEICDGEGMGLAIVKRIVERHGGEIWVESEVGEGTTFHFTLAGNRAQAALSPLQGVGPA